ncbi:MAG: hypothetical protein U5L72_09440 [Bacteroidales bacterium]|nr:hypothetical protein [Bacteroidales bacterium]
MAPDSDIARGFTPDGTRVSLLITKIFITTRYSQLFTAGIRGGYPEKLEIPNAHDAAWSPDGSMMAYNPIAPRHGQWKKCSSGGSGHNLDIQASPDRSGH